MSTVDNLNAARRAKQDEFYTKYEDIQKEVEAYLKFDPDTFRDKIVYCNCDDPFESNFFKYFAINFNRLGLKKLITTSYDGSPIAGQLLLFPEYDAGHDKRQRPKAIAVILDHVDGDGTVELANVERFLTRNRAARIALKGDARYGGGDFRSSECVEFLKQADIVVTNPPFSLFPEYIGQLVEHEKKFLILGNPNAVAYKNVFPLLKENIIWLGATIRGGSHEFRVPDHYQVKNPTLWRIDESGTRYVCISTVRWFTNLPHGHRPPKLQLMTMADNLKLSKHKAIRGKAAYDRYDNYDAIEVPYTDAIPSDYDGVMGVPITFFDKYNPEQFEILGHNNDVSQDPDGIYGQRSYVNGKATFKRIFIRHRRPARENPKQSSTSGLGTAPDGFDEGHPYEQGNKPERVA